MTSSTNDRRVPQSRLRHEHPGRALTAGVELVEHIARQRWTTHQHHPAARVVGRGAGRADRGTSARGRMLRLRRDFFGDASRNLEGDAGEEDRKSGAESVPHAGYPRRGLSHAHRGRLASDGEESTRGAFGGSAGAAVIGNL